MNDLERAVTRWAGFLKDRSLRLTAPRRAAVEAVMAIEGHFGLDDLRRRLAKTGAHRATLFRILPLLEEAGILRRVRVRANGWRYEHAVGHLHHDHLVCERCGRLVEFRCPRIEREQERLCRAHGFSETSHLHVIRGLCRDCREPKHGRQAGRVRS